MEINIVVESLSALAQETRIKIFRMLVQVGPKGLPAGELGERLAVPAATLSFHLKALTQAGLILKTRQGRSLIYSPNFKQMQSLLSYLTKNCCGLP